MTKWIILSLFVFSASTYVSSDAHARRSSHGHSHGRAASFKFRSFLPSHRSHSRPVNSTRTYEQQIYQYKKQPLPRIYTLDKPLINDAVIFRLLNFRRQRYYPSDFYRYDQKENQYFTPRELHADARNDIIHWSVPIEVNGQIFYYNDGFFYRQSGKHLIVVPPAINSIVKTIPKSSTGVGITGSQYEHNGIYFRKIPQGYQVVSAPGIKAGF